MQAAARRIFSDAALRKTAKRVMQSYLDKSLTTGEHIIYRGRFHWLRWVLAWAALILFGWVVIGVIAFAWMVSRMMTTDFGVTNRRVVLKRGFFTRTTEEIASESVESVELRQGVFGRIFNFGSLRVSGTGDAEIQMPQMAAPIEFRAAVEKSRTDHPRSAA